jgi:hypothetical protein
MTAALTDNRTCDVLYAERLESIYGGGLGREVMDALARERAAEWPGFPATTPKPMVLGIGPGSSGSRSLFLALALLNVAGTHYHLHVEPPGAIRTVQASSRRWMSDNATRFYGDTPVPTSWLRLGRQAGEDGRGTHE